MIQKCEYFGCYEVVQSKDSIDVFYYHRGPVIPDWIANFYTPSSRKTFKGTTEKEAWENACILARTLSERK